MASNIKHIKVKHIRIHAYLLSSPDPASSANDPVLTIKRGPAVILP